MKAIVYWPDRLRAETTEVFRNVTAARVQSGGYTIRCSGTTYAASSTGSCEVVLLPDDEEDIGQS